MRRDAEVERPKCVRPRLLQNRGQAARDAEPSAFAKAKAAGTTVPGTHSALFAPDREPTIRTGAATLTLAALELLAKR